MDFQVQGALTGLLPLAAGLGPARILGLCLVGVLAAAGLTAIGLLALRVLNSDDKAAPAQQDDVTTPSEE